MCSLLNLRGKYIYALHNLTDNSFASAASLGQLGGADTRREKKAEEICVARYHPRADTKLVNHLLVVCLL